MFKRGGQGKAKEERISSREMTTPEQEPGNQREARSRLAHQPSTGSEGHSRDVLPPGGGREHCSKEPGQPLGYLEITPFFHFQPLAQEPHCSSSSQEMGLEKTSLSNQRS